MTAIMNYKLMSFVSDNSSKDLSPKSPLHLSQGDYLTHCQVENLNCCRYHSLPL